MSYRVEGPILIYTGAERAPKAIDHHGHTFRRYMDRLFLPDRPANLPREVVRALSLLRVNMASRIIDNDYNASLANFLVEVATPASANSLTMLDFGCGDGSLLSHLHTGQHEHTEVVGIDICNEVIQYARLRRPPEGVRATFHTTGDRDIDLRDDSFDCGIACFVMHFRIDANQARDLHRIMKRGGTFAYNDYMWKDDPEHYRATLSMFEGAGFSVTEMSWRHKTRRTQRIVKLVKPNH